MLRSSILAFSALASIFIASYVHAAVTLAQKSPEFTAKDVSGKTVNLADFKGKHVVLEWVNPGCPFVRKHYNGGNMQSTQKDAAAKGAVWLAINSTESAHTDYLDPAKLGAWMKEKSSTVAATLMDENGSIGKLYGAKTTPHMYIINPQGNLVYAGGIDSIPSAREGDIAKATNYVKAALAEAAQGKAISTPSTAPYGCSVKYKS